MKYKEEQEHYSSPTGAIKNNDEQTLVNSKVYKNQFMCIKFSDL